MSSDNIVDVEECFAPNGDFGGAVILRESGEEIVICEDEWTELRAKVDKAFGLHHKLLWAEESGYSESPTIEADPLILCCLYCGEEIYTLEGEPVKPDTKAQVCLDCKHIDYQN